MEATNPNVFTLLGYESKPLQQETNFFSRIVRSLSQRRHLMTEEQMIPQLIYKETHSNT